MSSSDDLELLKSKAKRLQEKLDIKDRKYNFTTFKNCFIGSEAVAIITNLKFADDAPGAIKFGNELMQKGIIQHVTKDHTFKNEKKYYAFCESIDLSKVPNLETIKYTSVRKNKPKKEEPSKSKSKSSKEEQDEESKYNSQLAEASRQYEQDAAPSLNRADSSFDFAKPKGYDTSSYLPYVKSVQIGLQLLRNPQFNKGLAFNFQERREFNLHGLLPATYRTLDIQSKQIMNNIDRMKDPLDQYVFFMNILDTNQKLFYRTLCENLPVLMPIVYTPTVGLACQKFGDIFVRPRGMYITIRDKGRIYQILKNWPTNDVRAICFTDGERILGLGDLGAQGMGIPIGKLALYTGCAGVRPHQLLPVTIDCGCNTKAVRENEFYIGLREERNRSKDYDDLIEEFMKAATYRWGPATLLQFEDFGNRNAFRLLEKFKDKFCTFNDDIQGTAAVALAGVYSALRVNGGISKLSDHVFVMFGAGSAGVGISNLIVSAIAKESGKLPAEARRQIWLVDSRGLVFKDRPSGGVTSLKEPYAHEWDGGEIKDLDKIVEAVKGTALMGVSGQGQTFNELTCKALLANNPRPIIFPMSNPTHKAECSAEDAYKWTNNQCIFASGSPFPRMKVKLDDEKEEVEIVPAQGNNAYIFPGVALGIIASRSTRIPDDMFLLAANVLSTMVTDKMLARGTVFPPVREIRNVSFEIATRIAAEAYRLRIATQIEPKDLKDLIRRTQYDHLHNFTYSDSAFDNLEKEFMSEMQ
eukprot:CAMPEP_0201573420 /NCGR_PEP_ID=MMETSP0190_2-20130828/17277_1 /ASSEMBLY_ACC=CAM_ASM_000263 /TAXON_ID=37353 /ORGANISM="Rosalina sp." /LENGTH=752 /DNA_ID=CAMNT_0048000395 /DNA_START=176 /DNA_END=2434 /DNA_ORIENTATION=-